MANADLLAWARGGDGEAFRELTEPYRRELLARCYRMLASAQDAEDAMQDTMLAAWQNLGGFEERASLRTWLYRIATNRCLNTLRSASRRPAVQASAMHNNPAQPPRLSEVSWLEPYPDLLLEGIPDRQPGPEARYEASEAISLAFVTALQLLPPRQRAALVLCDVLGYRAGEAASMLGTSYGSVASAYTAADLDSLLALLTEDVRLTMPPHPFKYRGRTVAAQGLGQLFAQGHRYQLIETRANGQPAFALYRKDPHADILHASGLLVITMAGTHISAMTMFGISVLARFGLPRTLPV
jgi:RNA polymerase sigma factor (sigma-70 family)